MNEEVVNGNRQAGVRTSNGPGFGESRADHGVRLARVERRPRVHLRFIGYGIVASGLPASCLPESRGDEPHALEWTTSRGDVTEARGSWAKEDRDGLTVGWGGYARYHFRTQRPYSVQAVAHSASDEELFFCFLLSAVPLALPLFDLEPLHGSGVLCRGGAILLLGSPRAGKSSLASALERRGYGLLTDDACAVDAVGQIWPGPPLIASTGPVVDSQEVGRFAGKKVRRVSGHRSEPLPIAGTLVLAPAHRSALGIRGAARQEVFTALLAHVRAPAVLRDRRRALQLGVVARLGRGNVGILSYAPGRHSVEETADVISNWTAREVR